MTDRQRQLLHLHTTAEGYPPSIREMREHFGWKATNTVVCHLNALRNKGLVTWVRRRSRSYVLTRKARQELRAA